MVKFSMGNAFRPARGLVSLAAVTVALACAGCGEKMSGAYVPSAQNAREALESALKAWQDGQKPDDLAKPESPVHVSDQVWQSGQKLTGYSIVSEDSGEDTKKFTVSLNLQDPKNKSKSVKKEVHYVVIGQKPLWVYREEDFARMLNMDNNGPAPKRGRGGR